MRHDRYFDVCVTAPELFFKPGIQVVGDACIEMFAGEALKYVDEFHEVCTFRLR